MNPEGGFQKAALVVLVVMSSLKNPQGFLNTQRSATKLCVHIRADIPHRLPSQIFELVLDDEIYTSHKTENSQHHAVYVSYKTQYTPPTRRNCRVESRRRCERTRRQS